LLNPTLQHTNHRLAATDERVDGIGEDVDPLAKSVQSGLRRVEPRVKGISRDVPSPPTCRRCWTPRDRRSA
jgi:hypothetical protein